MCAQNSQREKKIKSSGVFDRYQKSREIHQEKIA
jgi:hypothetical protein